MIFLIPVLSWASWYQDNPNHHDCRGRQPIWWVHFDGDLKREFKHHWDHPSGTQFTIKTGPCRALELQFGQQLTTKNLAYSYPQKLALRGYWDCILACFGTCVVGHTKCIRNVNYLFYLLIQLEEAHNKSDTAYLVNKKTWYHDPLCLFLWKCHIFAIISLLLFNGMSWFVFIHILTSPGLILVDPKLATQDGIKSWHTS